MIEVVREKTKKFNKIQAGRTPNFNFDDLAEQIKNPKNANSKIVVTYPINSISNLIYALKRRGLSRSEDYNLVHIRSEHRNQSYIVPRMRG